MQRFLIVAIAASICFAAGPGRTARAQNDLKVIPDPDPELERETFQLPEGFEVNLFAADPQIAKPIQMNFDPSGRLWLVSSDTYPQVEPGATANDRVLVLADEDGDGVSDGTTIFADGLLIPTAVAFGDGGVYVGASTELLFFQDTDGDGRADERRTVLSGFGTEDTHHIVHTFRWGPEALLYFSQSIYIHSHIETPWGVRRLNAGGIWRFRPETLDLNVFARGLVNSWGTAFDAYGQTFATDGAGGEGINYIVPGASYVTAAGASRILQGLNPGSPKHCGLEIASSPHLPDDWQGSLLTNDFRGHRVCRFVVSEDGSGFRSQEQQEVIKSDHPAFRPVDIKMGPDGAIYIADWYNPIIQHGEVDFRDPRRDHVHGRIWRVTYRPNSLMPRKDLAQQDTAHLLQELKSTDQYRRTSSKRVLKERGSEVVPAVRAWMDSLPASPDHDRWLLEGLWTLQALQMPDAERLERCLTSQDHRVRAAAVRILGHWFSVVPDALARLQRAVNDEHPRVRLEAVRALGSVPRPAAAVVAMEALDHEVDTWLDYALWLTARELQPVWEPAMQNGNLGLDGKPQHLAFLISSAEVASGIPVLMTAIQQPEFDTSQLPALLNVVGRLGDADQLTALYQLALDIQRPAELRSAILKTLAQASAERQVIPQFEPPQLINLLASSESAIRLATLACIGNWQVAGLQPLLEDAIENNALALEERLQAVSALANLDNESSKKQLVAMVEADEEVPLQLRQRAVAELLEASLETAMPLVIKALQTFPNPQDTQPLFEAVVRQKEGPAQLRAALHGVVIPKDVAVIGLRAVSSSGIQTPELTEALQQSGGLGQQIVKLTPEQMQKLSAEISSQGDPARGETVYRRDDLSCIRCHSIGTSGGQVGPNLLSLGSTSQLDYIIESLLDPNAKVKEGFHTQVVATDDGKVITGIRLRESDRELFLRDAEGKEIAVPLSRIEQQMTGGTLMPAGLTSSITHQELLDLCAFLSALGRLPEFTISTSPLVRNWEVLMPDPSTEYRLRRTSIQAAAEDEPGLSWAPRTSHVNGELSISEIPGAVSSGTEGKSGKIGFLRVHLTAAKSGSVSFQLNDATGLQAWIDETPVTMNNRLELPISEGDHRLTFAVDIAHRQLPFKLEWLPDHSVPLTLPGAQRPSGETPGTPQ